MILVDLNQPEVTLQVFALNPDGTEKLDVSSGSVRVYYMSGGSEATVLASQAVLQVGATSVWRYTWNPVSLPAGEYVAEYTVVDVNGNVAVVGEDVVVRDIATQAVLLDVQSSVILLQADLEMVRRVETGRWKIEANQMVFFADDGVTPLLTFDLKDDAGLPSMTSVFERIPV